MQLAPGMDLAPLLPRAIFFEFKGRRGEKKRETKRIRGRSELVQSP
jgi:hypothetical protein